MIQDRPSKSLGGSYAIKWAPILQMKETTELKRGKEKDQMQ